MYKITEILNKSSKEIEAMNPKDRKRYYENLRDICESLGRKYSNKISPLGQNTLCDYPYQGMTRLQIEIAKKHPLRNFDFPTPIGMNNIPDDGCIITPNHSNVHDAFTTAESLFLSEHPSSFLAAKDGISPAEVLLFKGVRSTMIDRANPESTKAGLIDFSSKIIMGDTGVVFPEATWCLHPLLATLNHWPGAVRIAAITGKPIILTDFEYVEVPHVVKEEKDLYEYCQVYFSEPIYIDPSRSIEEQVLEVQKKFVEMRKNIWKSLNIKKDSLDDIDPRVYVNHTWMKIYRAGIVEYPYDRELCRVRRRNGEPLENMYCMNENGELVPGKIEKGKIKTPPFWHNDKGIY